jgi:hypothetical protein
LKERIRELERSQKRDDNVIVFPTFVSHQHHSYLCSQVNLEYLKNVIVKYVELCGPPDGDQVCFAIHNATSTTKLTRNTTPPHRTVATQASAASDRHVPPVLARRAASLRKGVERLSGVALRLGQQRRGHRRVAAERAIDARCEMNLRRLLSLASLFSIFNLLLFTFLFSCYSLYSYILLCVVISVFVKPTTIKMTTSVRQSLDNIVARRHKEFDEFHEAAMKDGSSIIVVDLESNLLIVLLCRM